jgi:hypothetical protein
MLALIKGLTKEFEAAQEYYSVWDLDSQCDVQTFKHVKELVRFFKSHFFLCLDDTILDRCVESMLGTALLCKWVILLNND